MICDETTFIFDIGYLWYLQYQDCLVMTKIVAQNEESPETDPHIHKLVDSDSDKAIE